MDEILFLCSKTYLKFSKMAPHGVKKPDIEGRLLIAFLIEEDRDILQI